MCVCVCERECVRVCVCVFVCVNISTMDNSFNVTVPIEELANAAILLVFVLSCR